MIRLLFQCRRQQEAEISPRWRNPPIWIVSLISKTSMSPDPETLHTQPIMSLDCVHCWTSKCWSVQLQWHMITDPSHWHLSLRGDHPNLQRASQTCLELRSHFSSTASWPGLCWEGQRLGRWSCVSFNPTDSYFWVSSVRTPTVHYK